MFFVCIIRITFHIYFYRMFECLLRGATRLASAPATLKMESSGKLMFFVASWLTVSVLIRSVHGQANTQNSDADPDMFASYGTSQTGDIRCRDLTSSCEQLGDRRPLMRCYKRGTYNRCCATCERLRIKDAPAECAYGDLETWCSSIGNLYAAASCYDNEDTCCSTCQKLKRTDIPGCPYGDLKLWCNELTTCTMDVASKCCASCYAIKRRELLQQQLGNSGQVFAGFTTRRPVYINGNSSGHLGGSLQGNPSSPEVARNSPHKHRHNHQGEAVGPPVGGPSTLAPRLGRINPYELIKMTVQSRTHRVVEDGQNRQHPNGTVPFIAGIPAPKPNRESQRSKGEVTGRPNRQKNHNNNGRQNKGKGNQSRHNNNKHNAGRTSTVDRNPKPTRPPRPKVTTTLTKVRYHNNDNRSVLRDTTSAVPTRELDSNSDNLNSNVPSGSKPKSGTTNNNMPDRRQQINNNMGNPSPIYPENSDLEDNVPQGPGMFNPFDEEDNDEWEGSAFKETSVSDQSARSGTRSRPTPRRNDVNQWYHYETDQTEDVVIDGPGVHHGDIIVSAVDGDIQVYHPDDYPSSFAVTVTSSHINVSMLCLVAMVIRWCLCGH